MNFVNVARSALQGFFGTGKEGFEDMSKKNRLLAVKMVEEEYNSDPGRMLNRYCFLGSQIVELKDRIPRVEKQARKTPPKHMEKEWKKVEAAKILAVKLKFDLISFESERIELQAKLEKV